jgi:hypothetical protein
MAQETAYCVQAFNARKRRAPGARFSDRLQIGKQRSSNDGETGI